MHEEVMFEVEGKQAGGYLALPSSGEGPGVLVLHAWWGLKPFIKEVCDRLAAEGFVALAPDLYEGRTADTIEQAEALLEQNDQAAMEAATKGSLAYLRAHPAVRGEQVGVMGFSMGAAWALLLATAFEPEAVGVVVLFYGNYSDLGVDEYAQSGAAFLGHFADDDPYESLEDVRQTEAAMRQAGRAVTFHVYEGVGHWFFEADRPDAYDVATAELAWQRTLAFLRDHL